MTIKNKEKNELFGFKEIEEIIDLLFESSLKENSRSREHIYEKYKINEEIKKDKNRLRSQGFFIF